MSQVDLSEASGLDRTHISAIERGRTEPRFLTLVKLGDGLGGLAEVFALCDDER